MQASIRQVVRRSATTSLRATGSTPLGGYWTELKPLDEYAKQTMPSGGYMKGVVPWPREGEQLRLGCWPSGCQALRRLSLEAACWAWTATEGMLLGVESYGWKRWRGTPRGWFRCSGAGVVRTAGSRGVLACMTAQSFTGSIVVLCERREREANGGAKGGQSEGRSGHA